MERQALGTAILYGALAAALAGCSIGHSVPSTPGGRDVLAPPDDGLAEPDVPGGVDRVAPPDDGLVEPCGRRDQPCCTGGVCYDGIECVGGATCACGRTGQRCCPDSAGNPVTCEPGLSCLGGFCDCGGPGAPCCESGSAPCGEFLECSGGTCVCGGEGQVCCADGRCEGDLACAGGRCARPPSCGASDALCGPGLPPCCAGLECDATAGSRCAVPRACGHIGQPCCAGEVCHDGETRCWNPFGVGPACVGCGRPGQVCCPGNTCRDGSHCHETATYYGPICVRDRWGRDPGEHCGDFQRCQEQYNCRGVSSSARRCVECGDLNETCCPNATCGGSLRCTNRPGESGIWICVQR